MSSGKQSITLGFPRRIVQWLDDMVKAHSLPDRSKAIRCCINCVAMIGVDFSRGHMRIDNVVEKVTVELAKEQMEWMQRNSESDASQSNTVVGVIQACQKMEEQTVFGVVRCKKKINECANAKVAVKRIEVKYGYTDVEEEIKLMD
mmetsp:Transcript_2753/g.4097  ORF Transcript_2753/g.4097 Transcript_2753/m.4097 type:complete len:146 (-) Transcript_2753:1660-2097(-)